MNRVGNMDNCLVVFISGNHAILVKDELKKMKINAKVESTPCSIAKEGCSYCIKLPCDRLDKAVQIVKSCNVPIRNIYKILIQNGKRKYSKIE